MSDNISCSIPLTFLNETADQDLPAELVGRVYEILNAVPLEDLPPGLQSMFCVDQLDYEVGNGGFFQLFDHKTGAFISEIMKSLRRFGAKKRATILEEAMNVFEAKGGWVRDSAERWEGEFFEGPGEEELTRRYHALDPIDVRMSRILAGQKHRIWQDDDWSQFALYVRSHPEEFVFPRIQPR